jgi:hypothetical protein
MAFVVSPGHDAKCLFLIALIDVGFVRNHAAAWRYQITSGCVFSSYTLWMALVGSGCSGRNLVGGFVVKTMSVFLLMAIGMRGTRHSFAFLSYHPRNIACLVILLLLYPLHCVYVDFLVIKNCDVSGVHDFRDAEEGVFSDGWYGVCLWRVGGCYVVVC